MPLPALLLPALIGAGVGALGGAKIDKKKPLRGALIGAGGGGLLGAAAPAIGAKLGLNGAAASGVRIGAGGLEGAGGGALPPLFGGSMGGSMGGAGGSIGSLGNFINDQMPQPRNTMDFNPGKDMEYQKSLADWYARNGQGGGSSLKPLMGMLPAAFEDKEPPQQFIDPTPVPIGQMGLPPVPQMSLPPLQIDYAPYGKFGSYR